MPSFESQEKTMLLSQRVAEDTRFLKINYDLGRRGPNFIIDMRLKIMRSTKIIVGTEFVEIDDLGACPNQEFSDGRPIGYVAGEMSKGELTKHNKDIDRRYALYIKYCKMPMPIITIESSKGMYLAEKIGEDRIRLTVITPQGEIMPTVMYIHMDKLGPTNNMVADFDHWFLSEMFMDAFAQNPKFKEVMAMIQGLHMAKFLDALLHFNVANSRIHKYCLTKREAAKIPKAMVPKYEYHIVDVWRERTTYHSLREVEEFTERNTEQRKAHFVIGHYKEISGKLWWWNPFVRNRKNADTVGVVIKDYRLH
jgi:hypothetical protein